MMKTACYLAAACLLFASCSKDDVATEPDIGPVDPSDIPEGASEQRVSLNVTSPETDAVTTRGTGTVGGVNAEENVWHGQTVNIFMFLKGTLTPTYLTSDDNGNPLDTIYYDTEMYTPGEPITKVPSATKGLASCINGDIKYYPMQGVSDFWGYRLDDARTGSPRQEGNKIVVPFKIDGSQDILAGTTDRESDLKEATDTSKIKLSDLYSAKAATYEVQPNIVFKHELTRIKFLARAENSRASKDAPIIPLDSVQRVFNGTDSVPDLDPNDLKRYEEQGKPANFTLSTGVYLDTVKLYSACTGKLVVAYAASEEGTTMQDIIWTTKDGTVAGGNVAADSTFFCLKQKASDSSTQTENLADFTSTLIPYTTSSNLYSSLGEAMLVSPTASRKYRIELYMHQYVKSKEDWWVAVDPVNRKQEYIRKNMKYPATIRYVTLPSKDVNGNTITDTKGYSFNINLTISGLERIEVSSTLSRWEDGGSIDKSIE